MSSKSTSALFDAEAMRAAACAQAGIDATSDPDIDEPLRQVLASLKTDEAALSEAGAQSMHAHLLGCLVTRLRIRDTIRRHAAIGNEAIIAPVFITGLPRTGSTKLQRVLAATGQFQSIPLWKILSPLPDGSADDPAGRIALAEQIVAQIKQHFPRFYAGHPMVAGEPDEESLFLEMAFKADAPYWRVRAPGYMRWLWTQSLESSYRWLKSLLQFLQWQDERGPRKRRWILKAPLHLGRLDEIFTVFPDATVIQCHRDPVKAITSAAALAEAMRGLYSDRIDGPEAGRFALTLLAHDMARCLPDRAKWEGAGKRFIDVPFAMTAEHAVDTCGVICDRLGVAYGDEQRARVSHWDEANPPFKHGNFDYGLDYYGLSADEIRACFADYIAQYLRKQTGESRW